MRFRTRPEPAPPLSLDELRARVEELKGLGLDATAAQLALGTATLAELRARAAERAARQRGSD